MSFAAALLMIAQTATPQVADAPSQSRTTASATVRASARVIRAERIDFDQPENADLQASARTGEYHRKRDAAGTVWIEFN